MENIAKSLEIKIALGGDYELLANYLMRTACFTKWCGGGRIPGGVNVPASIQKPL
jgi:hypothetical protein